MKTLAIIGGGNLGKAILSGITNSKTNIFDKAYITRRNHTKIKELETGIVSVTNDNILATKNADIIILAIKPYAIESVLEEIKGVLNENKIVISVVTGTEISTIQKYTDAKVYRAMPNTAAEIKESITIIAGKYDDESNNVVSEIFNQVGKTIVIEESMMGSATVLGACGIAFALRYIRASIEGGVEIGFTPEIAKLIVAQTIKGACELVTQNNSHPEEEIDKVTTPGGITISGLNEMEHKGFSSSVIKGLTTSFEKVSK